MKTGALILASFNHEEKNKSSEEFSLFLPMYPLDGATVIKREIAALRKAALSPIVVLAGYQKDILQNHLSHNHVLFADDTLYPDKSLEKALETGLEICREHMDRVAAVPVEYPAFSLQTLQLLLECRQSAVPVYNGQTGWPRLFDLRKDTSAEPEKRAQP